MNKADLSIRLAIAGTVVATATTAALTDFPIKITPECMRALDDTRKFGELFKKTGVVKANPLWIFHKIFEGDADAASPATIAYLRGRRLKKVGSGAVSVGGIVSSAHTAGFNVPGAAREANASATTFAHINRLRSLGSEHSGGSQVQLWILAIVALKSIKLAFRGTKFAGAFVPAASIPLSIVTEFSRLGIDVKIGPLCDYLAASLHHAAFQELMDSGGAGPATRIIHELFAQRGATIVFGRYHPDLFIREPGGWKAIADKLSMS